MTRILAVLCVVAWACGGQAYAAAVNDGWQAVKCDAPVPAALIGKQMANERVVVLEARHKDIGLHDLGASEINDHLQSISWVVCGAEYMLLIDDHDKVRDALPFPAHSKEHPEFLGVCRRDGKDTTDQIAAVLDNTGEHAGKPMLPALSAWGIDERRAKFVVEPVVGLMCGRHGISTMDGGL